MRHTILILATIAGVIAPVRGADIDFVRDVRPILEKRCVACHGPNKQKSGLRLDIKAAAFKGGELYGPSILPRKAEESPLIQFLAEDADVRMPPEGERLPAAEVAILTRWVTAGASWPDGVDRAQLVDLKNHWSFKPLLSAAPPPVRRKDWPRNDIDRFILARLEQRALPPAPEADRVAWLRRVTFDLCGLPPTWEEVTAFLADRTSGAYERVVDRLLQSPRYGERWAQHWLDVVRYADTHGFEVNTERPHAWPYRDYVIRALNSDLPYDRFIREQIAGDAWQEDAATGFLVTASVLLPGQIGRDDASKRLARQDSLDEIVVNISQAFLGISLGCARCHDHKFDPFTQRDYYSLQAFISGVEYEDRELRTPEAETHRVVETQLALKLASVDNRLLNLMPLANQPGKQRPAVHAQENTDRFAPVKIKRLRFTIHATNSLEPCLDEVEIFETSGTNIALRGNGVQVSSAGETVVADHHELRFVNDGEYGNSRSWMSNAAGTGRLTFEFAREHVVDRVSWSRDRQGHFTDRLPTRYQIEVADATGAWRTVSDSSDRILFSKQGPAKPDLTSGLEPAAARQARELLREKGGLETQLRTARNARLAFAGKFRTPDSIHVLSRGDPEQPKESVVPAIPAALGATRLSTETPEQARRVALADWIASPHNPLTARVIVNRLWQGHFGVGLVETASDFGHVGLKPSHPELLDWLAQRCIQSKWSLKQMHRLIVLSATYRQSTRINTTALEQDADDRLLWRFPPRRLDAEIIRDAMLAISGELNLKMYGRGFDLFDKRGGLSGFSPVEIFSGEGLRRMIYAHKVRRERDAIFGVFDCPDAGQSTARRRESTTPLQALNLLNSRFTLERSAALATRIREKVGAVPSRQIESAYQFVLSRPPDPAEIATALPVVQQYGLPLLCRALFNSNEAIFLP